MKKLASLLFCIAATSANAGTLLGDDVSCSTSGTSWSCDASSAVVSDPASEFTVKLHTYNAFDVNIGSNTINFDVLLAVGNISGLGPVSLFNIDTPILGYTFSTNINGLDASKLSFTASSFNVYFDGLTTGAGQYLNVVLDLGNTAVSEPSVLALFVFGLAGVGFSRKKRSA